MSCIVHLAAITDVEVCQKNPTKCFDINFNGTQKILEMARKKDCKFVYLSTSHVYGVPKKIPIREDHPRNPKTIYSTSKLGGEICCEAYSKNYGMDISIIRLFSVYGPNSPHHHVISKIISQLMSQNSIRLGNLYPKRDFIYISDVIEAIRLIMKKNRKFNTFNVGTGKSYSIYKIINILKKITHKNIEIISEKPRSKKIEVKNIVANSAKLRRIGWKPKMSLQKGLELTFRSFQKN